MARRKVDVATLEDRLAYHFKDPHLLACALTPVAAFLVHRYGNRPR